MTRIFGPGDVEEAAKILIKGGTVIFPTETVYGLGARFDDDRALGKIYEAKGRPRDNPLILHIYKKEQLEELVEEIPKNAKLLMERFWPGPLTLIFKKKPSILPTISGGLDTVAIRMPSEPTALRLLEATGLALAAPSANLSGRPSPTSEAHLEEMMGRVDGIILAGDTQVGLESTVLDVSRKVPLLLRPGKVTLEEIQEVVGEVEVHDKKGGDFASPGLKYRHYAPRTPVVILEGSDEDILKFIKSNQENCAYIVKESIFDRCNKSNCKLFFPEGDLDYAAREYFRLLRTLDTQSYDIIYIIEIPTVGLGRAIMDRLERSSGGHIRRL